MIKVITNFINWLLSLFCIPTNDGSDKYIVTVSFGYIVQFISHECPSRIVPVFHLALINHHKLSIQKWLQDKMLYASVLRSIELQRKLIHLLPMRSSITRVIFIVRFPMYVIT